MRKALSNQQPGWAELLRLCRHQQRDNATTSECHHCPTAGRRPDRCAPEPCFWIEEPVIGSDVKKSPRSPRFGNRNMQPGNSKRLPTFAEMNRTKKRWQKVIPDLKVRSRWFGQEGQKQTKTGLWALWQTPRQCHTQPHVLLFPQEPKLAVLVLQVRSACVQHWETNPLHLFWHLFTLLSKANNC